MIPSLLSTTHFQAHKSIAECAHGYVVECTDALGQPRVMKLSYIESVLHPNNRKDNPYQEASTMKALPPHPNVVSLLDELEIDGWHCLVFEKCRGDLFDLLGTTVPLHNVKYSFFQLIEGIKHVHTAGFVHLDVSLENILLDDKDNVRITDFGLAVKIDQIVASVQLTGKTPYMAPELMFVHLQSAGYDIRSADFYSAGVCLFFLTFGHPPYQHPKDQAFSVLMKSGVSALCTAYGERCVQIARAHPDIVLLLQYLLVVPTYRISMEELYDYLLTHKFNIQ